MVNRLRDSLPRVESRFEGRDGPQVREFEAVGTLTAHGLNCEPLGQVGRGRGAGHKPMADRTRGPVVRGREQVDDSLGPIGSHPHSPRTGGLRRVRRGLGQLVMVGALALAFLLVPTLQGINLIADQSADETRSTLAADDVATEEVLRLVEQP